MIAEPSEPAALLVEVPDPRPAVAAGHHLISEVEIFQLVLQRLDLVSLGASARHST